MARAVVALRESIEICRALDHAVGIANALTTLCQVEYGSNDRSQAFQHQREALDVYRQIGDLWGLLVACNNLVSWLMEAGNLAEAQPLFEELAGPYTGSWA